MRTSLTKRRKIISGTLGLALVAGAVGGYAGRYELREMWLEHQFEGRHYNAAVMEKALMIAGGNPAEAQNESKEAFSIADEFTQARTAPSGIAILVTTLLALLLAQPPVGHWRQPDIGI